MRDETTTAQQEQFLLTTENGQPQEPVPSRDATVRRPWFDAMSVVARRKLNAPPEWEWYAAKVLTPTSDTLIEGAVPNLRHDGTPRSGPGKWKGITGQQCVVTQAEIDAARVEFERTTTFCVDCYGYGETIKSAGVSGRTYQTCRRCGGSGRATDSLAGVPVLAVDRSRSSTTTPNLRANDA